MDSSTVRNAPAAVTPRNVAPWIESMARLGYVSIGAVYILIGLIAAGAIGGSRRDANTHQALRIIIDQPFGRVLLGLVALGLIGYASWRFVSSFTDAEGQGSSAKGLLKRAFSFLRGAIYLAFAVEALRLVLGSNGNSGRHWTTRLMGMPAGKWLVFIAGAGVVAYAIQQMMMAWNSELGKHLRLGSMTPRFRAKIVTMCRFGIASRALVFIIIGTTIAAAALRGRSGEQDTGDALQIVGSWNEWLLAVVGIGLIAFGLYQLVNARYRDIRVS